MITMLKLMSEEIMIPSRPEIQNADNVEKLSCCTGTWIECFTCGMKFKRFCKLLHTNAICMKVLEREVQIGTC